MGDHTTLTYETRDRKAYLTLDRPERLNAIDDVMPAQIREAVERANDDDDVRDRAEVGGLHGLLAQAERLGDLRPQRLRLRRRLLDQDTTLLHAERGVVARAHEHEAGGDKLGAHLLAEAGRPDVEGSSVGALIGEVTKDLSTLMRQELELAKVEMKAEAKKAGQGAGMFAAAGFAGYNTMGMPTSTSTPMFAGQNSYFPSPTAGFQQQAMPMNMMMPGYAQPQMQMQMQPNAYQAAYGQQQMGYGMPMNMNMPMNMGMGVPPVGMAAGGGYEEGISPQQRDNIDRWRMSVAPAPQ